MKLFFVALRCDFVFQRARALDSFVVFCVFSFMGDSFL